MLQIGKEINMLRQQQKIIYKCFMKKWWKYSGTAIALSMQNFVQLKHVCANCIVKNNEKYLSAQF